MCPERFTECANLHNPVLEQLHSDDSYGHSHLFSPGHSFTATIVVSDLNAAGIKRNSTLSTQ